MRSWPCGWNKTAARHGNITDTFCVDQNGVELNNLRNRCQEDIYRPRIRMGMRALHVNDTLIFRGFEFRQMCVDRRRFYHDACARGKAVHRTPRGEAQVSRCKPSVFARWHCAGLALLKSTARHVDGKQ
jgi:hypothetical protein